MKSSLPLSSLEVDRHEIYESPSQQHSNEGAACPQKRNQIMFQLLTIRMLRTPELSQIDPTPPPMTLSRLRILLMFFLPP
jgi:hypothetical protein